MTQLTIHIGTYKTATSSIQFSLARSSDVLERAGIRYARTGLNEGLSKHLHLFDRVICEYYNEPRHYNVADVDMVGDLINELNDTGCGHLVISEEELSYPSSALATYLEPLREHADVRVVMVVRGQASFLESLYLQFVREPLRQVTATFDEFIHDRMVLERGDFEHVLTPWQQAFGHDAIQVIDFDELIAGGDFVGSFANQVGLPADLIRPRNTINPSVSPYAAELLRHIALNAPKFPRARLARALARGLGSSGERVSLLTPQRMRYLTSHYRDSNRRLRKTYGVDLDPGGPGTRRVLDDAALATGTLTLAAEVIGLQWTLGRQASESVRSTIAGARSALDSLNDFSGALEQYAETMSDTSGPNGPAPDSAPTESPAG